MILLLFLCFYIFFLQLQRQLDTLVFCLNSPSLYFDLHPIQLHPLNSQ